MSFSILKDVIYKLFVVTYCSISVMELCAAQVKFSKYIDGNHCTTTSDMQSNSIHEIIENNTLVIQITVKNKMCSNNENEVLNTINLRVRNFFEEQKAQQLGNEMIQIITGKSDVSSIFPQQECDLVKVDDIKRTQFIALAQWVISVIKRDIAEQLRIYISHLDDCFIRLVNEKWENGIYENCGAILDKHCNAYEIQETIFNGLTIRTILSISPDFFPSDIDEEFKKLVSIINLVAPYIKKDAQKYIESIINCIINTVKRYNPQAISEALSDYSSDDIKKSIEHFSKWVELANSISFKNEVV